MARSYQHIKVMGKEINELREAGRTRKEIAKALGLTKIQIKNFINRHNRSEKMIEEGIVPGRRGRPPKGYQQSEKEKDNEIKRLKMENRLLRDFLHLAGRR